MIKIVTATLICIVWIYGLFYLDRTPRDRTRWEMWLPTIWFFLFASHPLSFWLGIGGNANRVARYQEGNPFDATIFALLTLAGMVVLVGRSRPVERFFKNNSAILFYYLYCAVSISWSDYPFVTFKRWIKAIGDVVMVLILVTDAQPVETTKRLLTRMAFVLLPLSALFDKYYPNLAREYAIAGKPMISGVTGTKNELGSLCLMLGVAALWITLDLWRNRKAPHRSRRMLAHGFVVVLAYLLCKQADSMTSFSCLLMAGAVMVLASLPIVRRRRGLIHGVVWGIAGLSLFATVIAPSAGLLEMLGRSPTLTGRTQIWSAVLSVHTNPLIGAGFQNFWMGSRMLRADQLCGMGIQEAHDGYLQIYLDLGWIGVFLLGVVIFTGYAKIVALYRQNYRVGMALLAYFTAIIVYNISEAGFGSPGLTWEMLILSIILATEQFHMESRMKLAKRRSKLKAMAPPFEGH